MNEVSSQSFPRTSNTGASGINILIGIWLIISTFVVMGFANLQYARWNNVIVGILVALFALVRLSTNAPACWSWSNVILGVWLIISPFVLGFSHAIGAMWHNVIAGIVVGLLGWVRALSHVTTRTA